MKTPQLHIRNLDGASIQAECTACPFPEVRFDVTKAGSADEIIADLQRQFDEHYVKMHEANSASRAARLPALVIAAMALNTIGAYVHAAG